MLHGQDIQTIHDMIGCKGIQGPKVQLNQHTQKVIQKHMVKQTHGSLHHPPCHISRLKMLRLG